MEARLAQSLAELDGLRNGHFRLGQELFKRNAHTYLFDLFTLASLNRSICLLKGFRTLLEAENIVSAAPLLRVQIDTYLRYMAGQLVADIDDFALHVMEGIPVRRQRARDGQFMTDQYLVKQAAKKEPWIRDLYENASGYIHLSEKHYWLALSPSPEKGRLRIKISDKDEFIPTSFYIGAIDAFCRITRLLLDSVHFWTVQKSSYPNAIPLDEGEE